MKLSLVASPLAMALPFAIAIAISLCVLEPMRAQEASSAESSGNGLLAKQVQPVRIESETAEFAVVVKQVSAFVQKHGAEKVLLVVDLDNTLLAMNQDLGSDQWFNWQESLLNKSDNHPDLVSPTFEGLLDAQGILFALSAMHPPEPALPTMVNGLCAEGVSIFVLTSRGKEFRNSSERELARNGYDFAKSAPTIEETRGVFEPYDRRKPNAHGLDRDIIDRLGKPRSVTYSDGIYMTAGQHKGYLLRTLLARVSGSIATAKADAKFSAIVFVDDREKHTKRVHEAFSKSSVDLATFRYSREDGNVAKFMKSTKNHVVRDWSLLNAFTKTVLVK